MGSSGEHPCLASVRLCCAGVCVSTFVCRRTHLGLLALVVGEDAGVVEDEGVLLCDDGAEVAWGRFGMCVWVCLVVFWLCVVWGLV